MLKLILLTYTILLLNSSAQSQDNNLLLNPSFELSEPCSPTNPNSLLSSQYRKIKHCYSIMTADTYTPYNQIKRYSSRHALSPIDGENMVGMVTFSKSDAIREYIVMELKAPLKDRAKYCLSIAVCLDKLSGYYSNNIGITFTEELPNLYFSPLKPSIFLELPKTSFNVNQWDQLQLHFENNFGKAKYLVIGNFVDDQQVRSKKNRHTTDPHKISYMWIDQVVLTLNEEDNKDKSYQSDYSPTNRTD